MPLHYHAGEGKKKSKNNEPAGRIGSNRTQTSSMHLTTTKVWLEYYDAMEGRKEGGMEIARLCELWFANNRGGGGTCLFVVWYKVQ